LATPTTELARPGRSVGTATDFTLYFRIKPGHAPALREALEQLQDTPGYLPGDYRMPAAHQIAEQRAGNSPTAAQAVKRAVRLGQGQPIEQAIAVMMGGDWRSALHPDRLEGIGAFNQDREPTFQDPDY
jgi:enoyl-CoA hydratase/carnithine racemase